jgi:ribosomal protein S18 acetylase RimI-like enzyme
LSRDLPDSELENNHDIKSCQYLIGGKNNKYTEEDIEDYINTQSSLVVVCEIDSCVVGGLYAEFHQCYVYVADVIVDSEHKNMGIGYKLLSRLEQSSPPHSPEFIRGVRRGIL